MYIYGFHRVTSKYSTSFHQTALKAREIEIRRFPAFRI